MLALCASLVTHGKAAAEDVPMWVYHNFPPYVVNEDLREGISFELADMLTAMSDGKYQFNVVVMPRKRLNNRIADGAPGMVLWANPAWFGDSDRTRFLWSAPVLNDQNDVISPTEVSFQYDGPGSLDGRMLVGVTGHRYPGVDGMIETGSVERIDVNAEDALVRFIASGRGEVAIVAQSAARYFVQKHELGEAVHFSGTPHSSYQRHILFQPELAPVHAYVQDALTRLQQSPDWAAAVDRYALDLALQPQRPEN
ncbi:transporter substrate-binding domain-containing protein [uncultured Tateyamaria sp.]|uniref:substrate-binding periplasmic protein n=1 Tax=Tateyamaria sp. 1078 TaxID=3417464 RepID=UPI00262730D0|nr:transporter substrate-binding domain-containing protein [uncultured Tateyamaria sp.]